METRRLAAVLFLAAVAAAGTLVAVHSRPRKVVDRSWGLGPQVRSVATGVGTLTVAGIQARAASVELLRQATGSPPPPSVRVREGAVDLAGGCSGSMQVHLLLFSPRCGVLWRLRVPRGGRLSLSSRVGDVRVVGLAGELDAQAGVGNVSAAGLRSASVALQTQVGDVRAVFASAPSRVTARAGVGNVDLVLPPGAYALRLSAALGTVQVGAGIRNDPASDRNIDLSSQVGDVRVIAGA